MEWSWIMVLFSIIIAYYITKQIYIIMRLPPGPWSFFPFLGVFYKINQDRPHLTYTEWNKKYGDIVSFTLFGTQRAVVVSSEEAIRDVLINKQDQFSDRLSTFRISVLLSKTDVAFSNDTPRWRYMKKQLMAAMKQHGDGLKNLETKTLLYGQQMLKAMEEYKGSAFEPRSIIHLTLAHIMSVLVFGQSSDEDATAFLEDLDIIEKALQPDGSNLTLDIFPFLRYFVPPVRRAYEALINVIISRNPIYDKHITARRKAYSHPNVEVFIDHFLKLNIVNEADESIKNIDETDIRSMAVDMFTTGVSTTTRILDVLLAILVNHQDIQDTVYEEIDATIGRRQPRIEDKLSMPFTQAVILETLRYHSLNPLAVPHVANHDTELQGFLIPGGSIIFPNLWALHHDPRYWVNPREFDPTRWLEDGKIVSPDHIKKQRSLPFGAGRRQCPGEVFARNRLFILTTMLLQKFKFVPAEGHPRPKHDPYEFKVKFFLQPEPCKLSVKSRY